MVLHKTALQNLLSKEICLARFAHSITLREKKSDPILGPYGTICIIHHLQNLGLLLP